MAKEAKKGIAVGAIIGAVAGFLTGLLTAPKSGKETRDNIKSTADRFGSQAEKELKKLYKEVVSVSDDLRQKAAEATGKAKKEFTVLEENAGKVRQKLGELLSNVRDGDIDTDSIGKVIKEAEKVLKDLRKSLK